MKMRSLLNLAGLAISFDLPTYAKKKDTVDPKIAPGMERGLIGSAIGNFVKSVWKAFPDASLEVISIGDTGGAWSPFSGCCTAPTGSLMDVTPPTGRTVAYPDASFVQVEGDKIRSEQLRLTGIRS